MPNTAKAEAIRKAYGEYWEEVKDELHQGMYICLIDERSSTVFWNGIVMMIHDFNNHLYAPKSLQGIENNKGWIRIESEDDLPKEAGWFEVTNNNPDVFFFSTAFAFDLEDLIELYERGDITHYKRIERSEKPIY